MSVFIFIFGLLIGSFLNVCIYRIPREESIAFPPSHCTNCNHRIKFYDLIPVVSYLFLRGKCRECGTKISIRYPLVELFTGVIVVMLYLKYGLSLVWIKYTLLAFWVIVIGLIDLDTTDIYVSTTASGIALSFLFIIIDIVSGVNIGNNILGGVIGGGTISLIILLTKGMGWGDAELFLLGGLFMGYQLTLVAIVLSFVLGAIVSIVLILLHKKTRKDYIPFAPYISMAILISVLYGDKILQFYLP